MASFTLVDGLVDLGGVLVSHGDAIDAGVLEGEAHGRLAVFAVVKAPSPMSFMLMTPMPCGCGLLDVRRPLRAHCRGRPVL